MGFSVDHLQVLGREEDMKQGRCSGVHASPQWTDRPGKPTQLVPGQQVSAVGFFIYGLWVLMAPLPGVALRHGGWDSEALFLLCWLETS